MNRVLSTRRLRGLTVFIFTLLVIEFLDEFVFGANEAAWPLIRNDLMLSYAQIGLLLSVPNLISGVIEPVLGILGDVWRRRVIILCGGLMFALALLLKGVSGSFLMLMLAHILFFPASGAFVSLSQSALMDLEPDRHEQNMARWTFAGSAGVLIGALALGAVSALGLGWRPLFLFAVPLTLALVFAARLFLPDNPQTANGQVLFADLKSGFVNAIRALRRRDVLRWMILLAFSDLMLDVLYSYLALYFVDVVGVNEAQAGLAVAVWTGVGLIGDFLLIPLLERVRGLTYLRVSILIEFVLFPAFLLVPDVTVKLVILALLGFFNAGWYSILRGQLYSAMPGQSGTVMAIDNLFGLVGGLIPLGIGLAAEQLGLGTAMWLLMLGPIVLMIGIPRANKNHPSRAEPDPLATIED